MKTKTKLIGSAPTLEMLSEGINKYFFSEIKLEKIESIEKWALFNSKGLMGTFQVVKKKNRFRFERITEA